MLPGVPEVLSITETACVLGISKQTVERMVQAGHLKQTPGDKVSKADLIQYISSHVLADLPVL
jgi:excisionase family DNA binding protein